jgi:hypothetical protein
MQTMSFIILFLSFICHLLLPFVSHSLSLIPWLYFTPYTSFPIFTLPYLHLTPCLYFSLFLLYPFIFIILLFDLPLEPTTYPPSLTVLEWKVTILLRHA